MSGRVWVAIAAAVTLAAPTSAQQRDHAQLAVMLGVFVPARQSPLKALIVTDECRLRPEDPTCSGPGASPRLDHTLPVGVGGRLTSWLGRGAAIEGWFWYSPRATTVMAGARVLSSLAPHARTTSLFVMGGPAVIGRSGRPTSIGGSLGIALDVHPVGRVAFRPQIESYLYSAAGNFQQDLVLSLSISPFRQREENH